MNAWETELKKNRNIRAMIGGRGRPNIFWWLNWLVISPVLLLLVFGCVVATFGHRKTFNQDLWVVEAVGYLLLVMPIIFVVFYFIREDCDRRKNMEPFVVRRNRDAEYVSILGYAACYRWLGPNERGRQKKSTQIWKTTASEILNFLIVFK